MEFEWDEQKRQEAIKKHKVDMVEAALIFEGTVFTAVDERRDYGETRYISAGMADDDFFVVVHTPREGRTRLISAWKGGRDDRREYEACLAGRDQKTT